MKHFSSILGLLILYQVFNYAQVSNTEFRATWVITWEHISASSSVEQNMARVREILDNHKKANMSSVLFQVRQGGTAYYNSSYEPWGSYAGEQYPGYDPLEYAVQEAHKRGLELHAWFNVFNVSSTLPGTIANQHPEWICRDQNGNPMTAYRSASPGLSEVRAYTVNVAMEIVRNYDIDGLHLDYIRWNEFDTDDMINPPGAIEQVSKLDGDFDKSKLSKYAQPSSSNRFLYDVEHPYSAGVPETFDTWENWWRWSVTEFVKTLNDSIKAVKPWIRLSPAALGKYKEGGSGGWNGYDVVFQDAALWFNEGYVDQLTPMHYHWLNGSEMYSAISSDWEPNIQKGIADGRLYSVGPASYRLADNNVWGNHDGIVDQMRNKSWVDGFQFFSYGSWKGYNYWEEAGSTFFDKKVKIRNIVPIDQPNAPILALTKIDSLSYNLEVTPDNSELENQWYAIYRSEDNILNVNNDEIIQINFGNTEFTHEEIFTGLQNFNGTYEYFATTLNRYWNESPISNSAITDQIPSFAPKVLASIPSESDLFEVDKQIIINFSKSMLITSFVDNITITPSVQLNSLSWSNDNKTLTINTAQFDYNASYSLVISSAAVDLNGTMLDGNGDGIPGDDFILNFTTVDFDDVPPQIVYTSPASEEQNVDVASLISLVFNELVKEESLAIDGFILSDGTNIVDINYLHTQSENGHSVVNIQPSQLLLPSTLYFLTIPESITDTAGNNFGENVEIIFTTSKYSYFDITYIDDFTNPGEWWQPSGSGSTTGIFESGSSFGYTTQIALPSTDPKRSGKLSYLWDVNASSHLLREYLSGGTPQSTYFDTSYILQSYIFGDSSMNQVRLCIDENEGSNWGDHEVSKWITIDWYGWKLIEWQLSDPNSVGSWIGNEILTGAFYRIDSYQLTKSADGNLSGTIYFDDLRAVKKQDITTNIEIVNSNIPAEYTLKQNYPNPFNPTTNIEFSIVNNGLTTLKVYDVLGREVRVLVDEFLDKGNYSITFNASDLSSGIYIYSLNSGSEVLQKKMLLLK